MDRNYEELANAIVLQAVKDYREALKDEEGKITRLEVETFFRSNWFKLLTNIDPEMLIEKLKGRFYNDS